MEWIYGIHDWTGTGFDPLPGLDGGKSLCEDPLGRLWAPDEYYNLSYYDGSTWNSVPVVGWGQKAHGRADRTVATGVYYCRLDSSGKRLERKMILLR